MAITNYGNTVRLLWLRLGLRLHPLGKPEIVPAHGVFKVGEAVQGLSAEC